MPDLSDVPKGNVKKGKMGGSVTKNADHLSKNPYSHEDQERFAAEERQALGVERPSRPIPPNRPLPVISDSASEPREHSLKSKDYSKSLDEISGDASPHGVSQRKHTPATIPRTKFTSATPLEQRIAINSLRQKLDYEENEKEEASKKLSKKESGTSRRVNLGASAIYDDKESVSSVTESQTASHMESEISDVVDTTRIVQRLTQVQDYLKQATSLYTNLSTKIQLEESEVDHLEKLGKLIQQLRLQEQGYVDLLQRTLDVDESADLTPSSSVLSLRQDEVQADDSQQQELKKLQMQHALLKKIVDQQQQIQDLKRKQATLASLQEQAEDLMKSADDARGEAFSRNWKEEHEGATGTNETSTYIAADTCPHDEIDNEEAALFDADMVQRKLELENKLMSLQAKKEKMDSLLSTLKASRDTMAGISNAQSMLMPNMQKSKNGPNVGELETLQSKRAAIDQQQQHANQALEHAKDVQAKLQKLKEVKQRLEDLTHIVAEYEQSHAQPNLPPNETLRSNETHRPQHQLQGGFGGARPRDDAMHLTADRNSRDLTNGLDNRMRPAPPGGRSQRTAIDVTRNPSSKDTKSPSNVNEASPVGKNLATEDRDNDLTSKIKQLHEARQRLAFTQQVRQLLQPQANKTEHQASIEASASSAKETESDSESESVSTAEDLSWQEDPEFQAKVRRLQQAKEKLKHLQELVNSVQQDGLVMDELANISLSSKESSVKGEDNGDDDLDNAEEADETDEEDATTSEQLSDADKEEDDDTSSAVEEEKIDDVGSKQSDGSTLNNTVIMLDREIEYQAKLKQQKQELEKLLIEKQKLLDAQRQLSEIARSTLVSDEKEVGKQGKQKEGSLKDVKKQPKIKFDGESEEKLPMKAAIIGKGGNRVKYEDLQVPRIVKRISNLSVEPQYGSDSDLHIYRKKKFQQAKKRQTDFTVGSRPNPLVMSEIRRQREMFEQNKKLKFVEKQRRKRDSGDDNRSDGGTYSIRSDIDEGVGHSMFSADVTTAATWGGSTEQSSSEEDSAVGEEDFPEVEVEIDDEYEGNMDQPEEEEEEEGRVEEEMEGDDIAPLLNFKSKRGKHKKEKAWFRGRDRRENQRGKKRKLDSGRNRSTVSWSMNVSPDSSTRQRQRQLNLTPAHKLMRERPSRTPDADYSLWEEQCEQLRQQLASSTSLSTSLLRNQQTLLSMLQNQTDSFGPIGGSAFYVDGPFTHGPMGSGLNYQRNTNQKQQQHQILQALERCTNQLDRQHQEIRSLQREFQQMLLRQSVAPDSNNRVYAWDHQTLPYGNYGQRRAFDANMDSRYQNESSLTSSFKPDLAQAATSQRVFDDETRSRLTQTEATSNQTVPQSRFLGAGEPSNQSNVNSAPFLPFKFTGFGQDIKESAISTNQVDDRTTISKHAESGYNPLIYTDSELVYANKDTENRSRDVITTSYPTPSKSKAAKNLAERQKAAWPSFLKEPENIDSQSERSASYYAESGKLEVKDDEMKKEVQETEDKLDRLSVASNFSLFETMRDSIYSEVATLISMNESRPHYLVELFRELQLLTSDYLRQRALYALQDLVTRFLTEDSEMRQSNEPTEEIYRKWIDTAAIEQTPSESALTSDDERQEAKALEALSSQIRNNDIYDYAEIAESGSTMSTPTSNQDPPFATEGLGDTVINLDEALQKMRTYEERMAEARKKALNEENEYGLSLEGYQETGSEVANDAASDNSSAYDVVSETSSELQQPSIDTQKLDRQIKSVMMDLIPFLNEHMESHCNPKFLSELNTLIFKLAKQKEPGAEKQEFGRSFHRQLESVLRDSLSRFEGRSLKECGEDILINVSEILFNELAFFRLMQDLDRPTSTSGNFWNREAGNSIPVGASSGQTQSSASAMGVPTTFYDASSSSVGFLVNTSGTIFSPPAPRTHGNESDQSRLFEDGLEIQDVKDNEENGSDAEDEIEATRQFVNVELSVSESRPVASTGSGEEDVEEDQQSFPMQNIPPESSVGAQQQQQHEQQQQQLHNQEQQRLLEQQNEDSPSAADDDVDVNDMPEDDGSRISPVQDNAFNRDNESGSESRADEDERGEDEREEDDRDGPNNVDDASGGEQAARDASNEDGDESEVTVDDFPTKLTGLTEADLQTRMQSEQSAVEGAAGILSHLSNEQELADESAFQQQQQPQQQEQPSQQEQDQCDPSSSKKESE